MTDERTAAEKALEVTEKRMAQYGHPAEVYQHTAALWTSYLGTRVNLIDRITPQDVALMMVLFKMGREMNWPGEDNLIDMHGYLLVYERILKLKGI